MGKLSQRFIQFFVFTALGLALIGCQDAQYDAFRFGPNAGGDNSEEAGQVEDIE